MGDTVMKISEQNFKAFKNATAIVSEDVLSQEINGETVLLDLKSEAYFGLDEVGTRFWQLLHSESSLGSVFDILLSEYNVAPPVLSEDLSVLITQLREAGLLDLVLRKGS
jgi:hypothetical protein